MKKIKKKVPNNICVLIQVVWHLAFGGAMFGGGNYYLEEFQKTRDTIVQQVDRIEAISKALGKGVANSANKLAKVGNNINSTGKAMSSTGKNLTKSFTNVEKELKKVRKACNMF